MLREVGHFFRHLPGLLALKRGRDRVEFFELISERYDRAGMYDRRRQLVGDLQGAALEVGCGTGRMFSHYPPSVRLTALEPNPEFLPVAAQAASRAAAFISVLSGSGERLPFTGGSFDAVVLSMVLCSVPSVETVLSEVKRVLKPGGQLREPRPGGFPPRRRSCCREYRLFSDLLPGPPRFPHQAHQSPPLRRREGMLRLRSAQVNPFPTSAW
jgi:SAM-dependent methyltransferase